MWETISTVLTSANAWQVLIFLAIAVFIFVILVKGGVIAVKTKHFRIGQAEIERETIRRQVEAAHDFIMSIEGKINADTSHYNGYFTKFILERVYDKAIEWIMFNHISNTPMYVQDKQDTVCNLVYTFDIGDEFKTPEFKKRMCNWTQELIAKLVQTRELYNK
ncbi:MAG: hypothetical protein PUD00_00790 [Treponema berlinense]|uniref:hypothetical protein n=1 Tax=Treponema berlinense TaxID=225004 RepID=UPI0023F3E177|nr:hypothetical protein [Treponema berlinense]MDD5833754.1 hypothetical protein [Treponema berlinense]